MKSTRHACLECGSNATKKCDVLYEQSTLFPVPLKTADTTGPSIAGYASAMHLHIAIDEQTQH